MPTKIFLFFDGNVLVIIILIIIIIIIIIIIMADIHEAPVVGYDILTGLIRLHLGW